MTKLAFSKDQSEDRMADKLNSGENLGYVMMSISVGWWQRTWKGRNGCNKKSKNRSYLWINQNITEKRKKVKDVKVFCFSETSVTNVKNFRNRGKNMEP